MSAHVSDTDIRRDSPGAQRRGPATATLAAVAADAAGIRPLEGGRASTSRLRDTARGAVLDYRLQGGERLIAKWYARPTDAIAAHSNLRRLMAEGFAPPARHRVPEPLACFRDEGVLLMAPAAGERLPDLVGREASWDVGLRGAGAWLAQLHQRGPRDGRQRDGATAVQRLERRAARARAARPGSGPMVDRLLRRLAEREHKGPALHPQAAIHGRYHPGHVFLAGEVVTVVDLDGLAVGDPAADVAEFLYRLTLVARRRRLVDVSRDRAVRHFVEGYTSAGPTIPGCLVYHWSYSVASILLHLLEFGHPRLDKRIDACLADFEEAPMRVARALARRGDAA